MGTEPESIALICKTPQRKGRPPSREYNCPAAWEMKGFHIRVIGPGRFEPLTKCPARPIFDAWALPGGLRMRAALRTQRSGWVLSFLEIETAIFDAKRRAVTIVQCRIDGDARIHHRAVWPVISVIASSC
jgi:hypothetical protein